MVYANSSAGAVALGDDRHRPAWPLPVAWILVPAVVAAVALVLAQATDLDRAVVRLFYDTRSASFPLRANFWLDVVMHHWAKYAVGAVWFIAVAACALSRRVPALRPERRALVLLALALTLAPSGVTLAKATSARHCPWDMAEFGGDLPHTPLLEPPPRSARPGRCFPAGHASTGFALMAFYFAAYAAGRRRMARRLLALGVCAGIVLGTGRVMQGAHFPSHVVGSGLLCWTIMVVLYMRVMGYRPSGASLPQPP